MYPFQLKRVYEEKEVTDGYRVLVDRLWPRGVTKQRAAVDQWLKNIAPSPDLRKWFNHDTSKFNEFQMKYLSELEQEDDKRTEVNSLIAESFNQPITLIFAAKDVEHNHAIVLKQFLEKSRQKHLDK